MTAVSSPPSRRAVRVAAFSDAGEAGESRANPAPWFVYATVLAAAAIQLSLLWDVSWHFTIGRDSFWTPAHIGLYLGGTVAGATGAWLVFRATFLPRAYPAAPGIRIAGLRGPAGAWLTVWGASAMLTAALFDAWWHTAYGLDITILSPPHILLLIGMAGVQGGGMLLIAAARNRSSGGSRQRLERLQTLAAGLLVLMTAMITLESAFRSYMHSAVFYLVACAVYPMVLLSAAELRLRWPATGAALIYTVVRAGAVWILPLFPAEPRLGPVYFHPTHFVPPDFPLLLIVPAVVLDLLSARTRGMAEWARAVLLGLGFLLSLVAVQWPFASFLMTPPASHWFFAADNFRYNLPPTTYTAHQAFVPLESSLGMQLSFAAMLAIVSCRLGLAWSRCLAWIQR